MKWSMTVFNVAGIGPLIAGAAALRGAQFLLWPGEQ
jgi:hypothetical protein